MKDENRELLKTQVANICSEGKDKVEIESNGTVIVYLPDYTLQVKVVKSRENKYPLNTAFASYIPEKADITITRFTRSLFKHLSVRVTRGFRPLRLNDRDIVLLSDGLGEYTIKVSKKRC